MSGGLGKSTMVDVDLRGLLRDSSVGVYCWGYLLLGKLGVGSSILKIMYRGELLGLMAVHPLLLAVETVSPGLSGSATIYSDCLDALGRMAKLPPYRISSRCRHSDILKTNMVNCASLSFQWEYHHVVALQDDHTRWEDLTRATQLNLACDAGAKAMLCSQDVANLPP
jgi:hypothetical protein